MAVNVKKKDAQKVTIFQPSQELNNHGLLSKITMFFFHKSQGTHWGAVVVCPPMQNAPNPYNIRLIAIFNTFSAKIHFYIKKRLFFKSLKNENSGLKKNISAFGRKAKKVSHNSPAVGHSNLCICPLGVAL